MHTQQTEQRERTRTRPMPACAGECRAALGPVGESFASFCRACLAGSSVTESRAGGFSKMDRRDCIDTFWITSGGRSTLLTPFFFPLLCLLMLDYRTLSQPVACHFVSTSIPRAKWTASYPARCRNTRCAARLGEAREVKSGRVKENPPPSLCNQSKRQRPKTEFTSASLVSEPKCSASFPRL